MYTTIVVVGVDRDVRASCIECQILDKDVTNVTSTMYNITFEIAVKRRAQCAWPFNYYTIPYIHYIYLLCIDGNDSIRTNTARLTSRSRRRITRRSRVEVRRWFARFFFVIVKPRAIEWATSKAGYWMELRCAMMLNFDYANEIRLVVLW